MANSFSHAGLPFPVRHARFTLAVPYLDADGDPTDPTTPDTEVSKDAGAFADCTEEVTTISGSNGAGYITLTGAETDCALAVVAAKVASGPKNTLVTLYPRTLPIAFTGTASAGASATITLAGCPAITDLLIGCIVRTTGGTGGGGTGGANNQARVITAYTSGRVATVEPAWETTPSSDTTFDVLLTEASILRYVDLKEWSGTAVASPDTAGYPKVTVKSGTGTGEVNLSSGVADANVTKYGGSAGTFASGRPEVNATHWSGTANASPATAGYPAVTLKVGTGTGEVNLSSGAVPVKGNVKKNAAFAAFPFMMTDSTNHNPATSKTVSVTRSIDGGAFGSGTLSAVTEVANGIYVVDFAAGDTNGNNIILRATASGCDDTFERIISFVA